MRTHNRFDYINGQQVRDFMEHIKELEVFREYTTWISKQEQFVVGHASRVGPLEILEAGCGRHWGLKLKGVEYRLTGIDLDREALHYRLNEVKDLHEGIFGDLSKHDFQDRRFDVVYCSYVLEHIEDPEAVMRKFVEWLKRRGIMIIAIPDSRSVYGFVTRMTPHWFHVLYYRHILGIKDAGKPGFGPYETFYRYPVSRAGMHDFCSKNALAVVGEYGAVGGLPDSSWRKFLIRAAIRTIELASFGRLSGKHDSLLYFVQSTR